MPEERYVYTTIPPPPAHRIEQDDDVKLWPEHRVKYRKRRDKLQASSKGTMFKPGCTCGKWSDRWYQTKPLGKKMWFKLEHLPEVRLQVAFPGIQEVTSAFNES